MGTEGAVEIREAVADDAPALGHVIVTSYLAAHRGQVPAGAWEKRQAEWTPEVSAAAWTRFFEARATGTIGGDVLLVADEEKIGPIGLALGTNAEESAGSIAELGCLYVLPSRWREGIGATLLRATAVELAKRGYTSLHAEVIAANLPARRFYEAMGARQHHHTTVDEEGYQLPAIVYTWPDITSLAASADRGSGAPGPPA